MAWAFLMAKLQELECPQAVEWAFVLLAMVMEKLGAKMWVPAWLTALTARGWEVEQ